MRSSCNPVNTQRPITAYIRREQQQSIEGAGMVSAIITAQLIKVSKSFRDRRRLNVLLNKIAVVWRNNRCSATCSTFYGLCVSCLVFLFQVIVDHFEEKNCPVNERLKVFYCCNAQPRWVVQVYLTMVQLFIFIQFSLPQLQHITHTTYFNWLSKKKMSVLMATEQKSADQQSFLWGAWIYLPNFMVIHLLSRYSTKSQGYQPAGDARGKESPQAVEVVLWEPFEIFMAIYPINISVWTKCWTEQHCYPSSRTASIPSSDTKLLKA